MEYILITIIILCVLWYLCSYLVAKVRDKIENRAILKSRLKEDIQVSAQSVNNTIEQQLHQIRASVTSFQEMTYQSLPGLKDRIARDKRKQDYIQNVLPFKNQKVGSKRRKR